MADNYLERRMEDLKTGKIVRQSSGLHKHWKRAGLNFPFPPKRILIATEDPRCIQIARLFLKADCKVAVMNCSEETGEELAKKEGIRYYKLSCSLNVPGNERKETYLKDFDNLVNAWRDIDILISDSQYVVGLMKKWKTHRERFPYVSDYKSRIIVLKKPDFDFEELRKDYDFNINYIRLYNPETDISGLIGMLVLPANDFIHGLCFET